MIPSSLFSFDDSPLALELSLQKKGFSTIAGVDEAGRGALAGPVVAAAVILDLPSSTTLIGKVRDSKEMTALQRENIVEEIKHCCVSWGIGIVESKEIDQLNILQATLKAMKQAIEALDPKPFLCLIDGNASVPILMAQKSIVGGDARVFSISAASVLAKVSRDQIMKTLDQEHPEYGFLKNKGYGTLLHRKAIATHGPCDQHRRSFSWGK